MTENFKTKGLNTLKVENLKSTLLNKCCFSNTDLFFIQNNTQLETNHQYHQGFKIFTNSKPFLFSYSITSETLAFLVILINKLNTY